MLNANVLGLPFKPLVCNHPAPVLDGCVLWLDGRYGVNDPATGTWYDLAGQNHGTLKNFAFTDGSGWTGKGLQFDGVDDYVDCGKAVVPTDTTIEMLAYFNDVIKRQDNFWANNNSVGVYILRVENKSIRLALNNTSQDYIVWTTPQIITTGLHHITITQEGMDAPKIYLDGVQQAVNQATKRGNPIKPTTALSFSVGRKGEEAQGYFNGIIHNVFVYNRALSPREITQNYLAGRCIMPLRHIDNATTPAEVLQNELAAKFCPLFHDHYNTAGVEWEVAQSTKMTRLGTTVNKTEGSDFDSIYPYSEMKLCNVNDSGEITAYIGDSGFKRDGTNGQVMVKIPKFYYRHVYGEAAKKHQFWISEHPISGFKLHPAFMRAGVEKECIYMGAYKASIDTSITKTVTVKGENGEDKTLNVNALASVSGALPAVQKKRYEFRASAKARGDNWCIVDALARNAVALLYLVEYADTNSQSAIGAGVTDSTNTAAIASGGCDYLNGASGNAVGDVGKVSVSYRGLEDLWGNVWEFIDGINIENSEKQPYIADDNSNFADDTFTGVYTPSGVTLPSGNGYVRDFACSGDADWLLMPSAAEETGTGSSTYIPDYYYQNWGNSADKVALAGGIWHHGSYAGLFLWCVNVTSSRANLTVGARVLLIP